MKKYFKYVMLISFFSFAILLLNQSSVEATTIKTISTMEELKTAFEGKATIEGNTIKLTDNVILKDNPLGIEISEMVLDFNGKTIECKDSGAIYLYKKATLKDSSTTDRTNWGGIKFFSRAAYIKVEENAELIIDNGQFIDNYSNLNNEIVLVMGKLKINDATFSTIRTEIEEGWSRSMIALRENSETVINNGNFSNIDKIIGVEPSNGSDKNNSKLTINGGNFKSLEKTPISIDSLYPYKDENNNKKVITPKIVLNNCYVEGKYEALEFSGGCTDEEFRNVDTKVITILGGTYICSEYGYAAFEIHTKVDDGCYFNPKDFVIKNGTFDGNGRVCHSFRWTYETVNLQQFVLTF